MKHLARLATVVIILGMSGVVNALTITNGGFETGYLSGWSNYYGEAGGIRAVTNDGGFGPTQGSYFATLTADTELWQYISWDAGDTLSFDWNFYTYDWLPWNDFSIFEINDYPGYSGFIGSVSGDPYQVDHALADVADLRPYDAGDHYDLPGCDQLYDADCYPPNWDQPIATGWNTYTQTFGQAGSGYITFGVFNQKDNTIPSYLYIDNVGAPVPEPSTMILFGTGLLGLAGFSRRRKKK